MQIQTIKTKVFNENGDLLSFIFKHIKRIPENSVLIIASKVVALSEGRVVDYKNEKQKRELLKKESGFAVQTKYTWLTIKDGMFMASSGIDESNAKGKLILLPKDSFKSAEYLRSKIKQHFHLKKFGILISDSGLLPLRSGVIGVALGYAGFKGIKSYINKKDIFRRKFIYSKTDVADSLATAATLCIGEGDEQQPLALIKNAPVVFSSKINRKELAVSFKEDIFYPLLKNINVKKK
ncbi:coenzyme F420-0:L-glutamate ligase [Candidatus Nomurabacteria bacterium]|nr:coenzyme F420-0:L-glutamate ligase [Candidatus Nomurabacteria bacterium]